MTNLHRLILRRAGMFSNVNEVVEQLRRAERSGYRFVIDWSQSCYLDLEHSGDPWSYYFSPCFELNSTEIVREDLPVLLSGTPVACAIDNIITPRLLDGVCDPLLLPQDRKGASRIIEKYLHLHDFIKEKIDTFAAIHFQRPVIGLHIRGAGRVDGGVPAMRKVWRKSEDVPFTPFFMVVDQALKNYPDSQIFACSDSLAVMRIIKKRYGMKIISWPALRSEFGEMHANHPQNGGRKFSGFKLGLDVVAEAWLLARTSHLIHGNSNIANFILCLQPDLTHDYVLA